MAGLLYVKVGGAWVPIAGGNDEVFVGADDPGTSSPYDLWYDTDASALPILPSSVPLGLVAWKAGALAAAALSTTPITIYSIQASLTAGRAYNMHATARAVNANTTTPYVLVSASATPSLPPGFHGGWYHYMPASYGVFTLSWSILPTTTAAYTLTITAQTGAGAGTLYNDGGCKVWITDEGLAMAGQ